MTLVESSESSKASPCNTPNISSTLYISDIGYGWALSVLDTEEEYDFVRGENRKLNKVDQDTFLIDGSTQSKGVISYSQYNITYAPGKIFCEMYLEAIFLWDQ